MSALFKQFWNYCLLFTAFSWKLLSRLSYFLWPKGHVLFGLLQLSIFVYHHCDSYSCLPHPKDDPQRKLHGDSATFFFWNYPVHCQTYIHRDCKYLWGWRWLLLFLHQPSLNSTDITSMTITTSDRLREKPQHMPTLCAITTIAHCPNNHTC